MILQARFVLAALALVLSAACGSPTDGGPQVDTAPAAPTIVTVERLGEGGHVTWTDASDDEDEFMLLRKDGDGDYAEITRVPFNTTQFHDEPLTAGTTYTFMVMAVNDIGETASNEVTYLHE